MFFLKSLIDVFKIIYEEGEKEYIDETPFIEMLNELFYKLDRGDITEAIYEKEERKILKKLREIREYKKNMM